MTPHLLDILHQLSHVDFRSGEEVARRMGLSRGSVHNAVREAQRLGLAIQAVRGRGYRLAQAVTWLDAEAFSPSLNARGIAVDLFASLDSTNAHLLAQAQSGAAHKRLVVAEWQSQGRGRRGRTWLAGLGGGLMFSLLWRFNRPIAELSGLSLAVGLSLAQTLRGLGVPGAAVKWPNDILVDGAKLAGVLIELAGDVLGPSAAIIGVGLNVQGADALQAAVEQPVTDIAAQFAQTDRNLLLREIVLGLDATLTRFDLEGFAAFRLDWQALHAHQNQPVQVLTGLGQRITGQAVGVDDSGALLLASDQGVQRFHSGEVSVRAVALASRRPGLPDQAYEAGEAPALQGVASVRSAS